MSDKHIGSELLTAKEAAKLLGITEETLACYRRKGLVSNKSLVSGPGKYDKKDLLRLVAAKKDNLAPHEMRARLIEAYALAKKANDRMDILESFLGLDIPIVGVLEQEITQLHYNAGQLTESMRPLSPAEILYWGRTLAGMSDIHLQMVEHYLADPEPWAVFYNGTGAILRNIPDSRMSDPYNDYVCRYLAMTRKQFAQMSYFYARGTVGPATAAKIFRDVDAVSDNDPDKKILQMLGVLEPLVVQSTKLSEKRSPWAPSLGSPSLSESH